MKNKIYITILGLIALFTVNQASAQLTPMSIGTIEAGDSIMIYYSVKINDPLPNGTTQISSQGAISGSNISASNTDDPDTGPAGDATITPVLSNQAPAFANGANVSISVCQSSASNALNSLLAVSDADNGQTLTWTVITSPTKGTANGFPGTASSTGGTVTPTGLSYSNNGTTGSDLIVVQVSDGQATAQINVNITVNANPAPTITGSTSFCAGGSTTLNAGAGFSLYNWSTGATTQTINVNTATTVTVTVTNGNGCTGSDNETTTVNPNPTPSISGSTTICPSGSTTLDAGAGYSLYNWSTGATTQTINVNTATTVTVTVTNGNGCTGSDTKTTIVSAPAAPVISAGGPTTFCSGSSVTLTASSNAAQDLSFTTISTGTHGTDQWQTFVPTMNGLTTSIQVFVNGTQSASGTLSFYSGTGTGGTLIYSQPYSGSYTSGFTAFNLPGLNFTAGTTYTFRLQGADFGLIANNSGYGTYFSSSYGTPSWRLDFKTFVAPALGSLQWYNTGNPIGGANATTFAASTGGSYTCQNTVNSCPSAQSNAISVTVNALPTPAISGSTSFCAGGSTTLNAGAGYSLYNWSTGATTQTINVNTATTVTVTVTDGYGCSGSDNKTTTVNPNPTPTITGSTSFCTGGSTTLDAGAGYSLYNWSTGATTQTINVNTATTVTVTVTDGNGCTGNDSKTTTVNSAATPTITGSLSFCAGGSTTLDAGAGYSLYNWSTGATTQTINVNTANTFTVTVTNGPGCSGSDSKTTTVNPNPTPAITGNTSFCTGGSTTLNAGAGYSLYNWSTGATTQTINVNTATTVTVTVTDGNGCSGSDNETTTIITAPTAAISGNNSICLGQNSSVQLSFTGTGPWSGTVSDGSNTVPFGPVGTTSTNVTVTPSSGGTHNYTVTALSDANCGSGSGSGTAVIIVSNGGPTGSAGTVSTPATACSAQVSQISVNVITGQNVQYSWNTGTGSGVVKFSNNIGGPFSNPPFLTNTNSVYAQFGAAGGSGYDVCVQGANGCGSTNNSCAWIRGKVSVPGTIVGTDVACPNDVKPYQCGASGGTTNYSWTLAGSATPITNGQGSTNVQVTFPAAFVSGQLCVTASLPCGGSSTSAPRCMTITKNPIVPGPFTSGPSKICPGATVVLFTVPNDPSVTNYSWTYPAGCTVNGAANTNSLSLNFPANYSGAPSVCVSALSPCGTSAARCKTVGSYIPGQPAAIQGPSTNICNSTVQFEVTTDPNATAGYLWTPPSGTTITSGQGSNTILLSVANNFTSGNLTVIAKTASCSPGNSPARTLLITGKPNTPGTITASPVTWCSGATVHFAVTPVSPLPIYSWSTNKGTITAGQGTAGVDITWTAGSGYVNVIATNTCGASGTKSQTFTSSCREEEEQSAVGSQQLAVYPNPAHDMLTVSIDVPLTPEGEPLTNLTLQLTDIAGRVVLSENESAIEGLNTYQLGVNHLSKGVYMLDVKSRSESWKTKVVVE